MSPALLADFLIMWFTGFGGDYRGLMGYWYFRPLTLSEWRFIILFIARYLGLVVNTIAHWLYKSIPVPKIPKFYLQRCIMTVVELEKCKDFLANRKHLADHEEFFNCGYNPPRKRHRGLDDAGEDVKSAPGPRARN